MKSHVDELKPAEQTESEQKRPPRNAAEWVTFGIASIVLTMIAGLVIYS